MILPATRSLRLLSGLIANKAQLYSTTRLASTNARLFTKKHEWITLITGDRQIGRVGISNHAQEALGDVVYVQNPEVGAKIKQFDEVGVIESVKAASELMSPVSGEVTSVNSNLEDKPGLVNSDCYQDGWLFEIRLENSKELEELMDEDKYQKYLEESTES